MNSTQKTIVAIIIVLTASIIAMTWAEKAGDYLDNIHDGPYYTVDMDWYEFDNINRTWYAFLIPLGGAAFALYKLYEDK
jgi:hypothetical protein